MAGQTPHIVTNYRVSLESEGCPETSGLRVVQVAASGTAMRTSVHEPARSPQDAVPCDRLPHILFVGGGIETVPGVRRAKELGFAVSVSDRDPQAPCTALADHLLVADTYDPEATLKAAAALHHRHPLDGVLCLATDVPVTVATVAHGLALPGISLESARLAADKITMKECFRKRQVPTPPFMEVRDAAAVRRLGDQWGWPVVVKPADSRGARGVLRLFADADLDEALAYARAFSPTNRALVEKFLDGPQVSTESLLLDGACHTPGFSDRNYELLDRYAPHIIENGGELPSVLDRKTREAVMEVVGRAARAMGITHGVVKGDIVVHHGRPHVIELAARLSGGYFCSHEIPLNTGVDFVGCAIRQAVGAKVDPGELMPRSNRGVAQRYLFLPPGTVQGIEGITAVTARPEIALCEIRVRPGDTIREVTAHPERAGVVIAIGESRDQAVAAAKRAVRDIRITTTPTP